MKQRSSELTALWRAEKDSLASATKIKERLDQARQQLAEAERRGDLGRASELKYGEIPSLEKKLSEAEAAQDEVNEKKSGTG